MDTQVDVQMEATDLAKKDGKGEKSPMDYPVIKVQLPKEAALKVQMAIQTLKERKADTKADELLAEFLNRVTEEYLDDQIEKRTPEDYYFEAAKTIPELKEKIIREAKKALQRTDRPVLAGSSNSSIEAKRARKKGKEDEVHIELTAPEMTQ